MPGYESKTKPMDNEALEQVASVSSADIIHMSRENPKQASFSDFLDEQDKNIGLMLGSLKERRFLLLGEVADALLTSECGHDSAMEILDMVNGTFLEWEHELVQVTKR